MKIKKITNQIDYLTPDSTKAVLMEIIKLSKSVEPKEWSSIDEYTKKNIANYGWMYLFYSLFKKPYHAKSCIKYAIKSGVKKDNVNIIIKKERLKFY